MATTPTPVTSDFFTISGDKLFTNSKRVAHAFGKLHKDVLRKIESLDLPEDFTGRNFTLSGYLDTSGRTLKAYDMTKDGFVFLVMGFTGKKATLIKIGYINAFNEMARVLSGNFIPPVSQVGLVEHGVIIEIQRTVGKIVSMLRFHNADEVAKKLEWKLFGRHPQNIYLKSYDELSQLLCYYGQKARDMNQAENTHHWLEKDVLKNLEVV